MGFKNKKRGNYRAKMDKERQARTAGHQRPEGKIQVRGVITRCAFLALVRGQSLEIFTQKSGYQGSSWPSSTAEGTTTAFQSHAKTDFCQLSAWKLV
jgi:hypothetical protein